MQVDKARLEGWGRLVLWLENQSRTMGSLGDTWHWSWEHIFWYTRPNNARPDVIPWSCCKSRIGSCPTETMFTKKAATSVVGLCAQVYLCPRKLPVYRAGTPSSPKQLLVFISRSQSHPEISVQLGIVSDIGHATMNRITTNVDQKLLRTTKFPAEFNQKVDTTKINIPVIKK